MIENIVGKKIELKPVILKDNQIYCSFCGGVGWVMKDNKWIERCPHCSNGAIDICPNCKTPYETRYIHRCKNPECIKKEEIDRLLKDSEKEKDRLAKANKIEADKDIFNKYIMLYSDSYPYNEGYFADWDSFFDAWNNEEENKEENRPQYVWATTPIELSMDGSSIIENACEELWEGALDSISSKDIVEFENFIQNWCEKQTGATTYYVDYNIAIKIPWEE